jgi:hypothetical protein
MGQDPDAIEREIRESRQRISQRISAVQRRVGDDIDSLKRDAENEANIAAGELKGLFDLQQQGSQHPYTLVAGGLGLGVLLGVASESISLGGNGRNNSNSNGQYRNNGSSHDGGGENSGTLNGLMSCVLSLAANTFQDELKDLIRDGFASFKSSARKEPARRSYDSEPVSGPYQAPEDRFP